MFHFRKKDIQIGKFWDWFGQFVQKVDEDQKNGREIILDPLLEALNKIRPGLSAKVGRKNKSEWTLTISANGDINKFDMVEAIVQEAPEFPNWEIVAFRQPTSFPVFKLEVEGYRTFDVEQMAFFPLIDGDNLDLIIYIPDIEEEDREWIAYYGLLVVDMLLGEYDCVTKVRYYDFHDKETLQPDEDIIPLKALPQFIEAHYQQ